MADPNQTPERGDWVCPCNGCSKAVSWERKQLIVLIEGLKEKSYTDQPYELLIELIKDRMPKPKARG